MSDRRPHRLAMFVAALARLLGACANQAIGRNRTSMLALLTFNHADRAAFGTVAGGVWMGSEDACANCGGGCSVRSRRTGAATWEVMTNG